MQVIFWTDRRWPGQRYSLEWRHNGLDSVSNFQPRDCLFNRLFRRRSKKTSKLRVTGLCGENSPGTGESPAQMASNVENVSIWWRHHVGIVYQAYIIFQTNWLLVLTMTRSSGPGGNIERLRESKLMHWAWAWLLFPLYFKDWLKRYIRWCAWNAWQTIMARLLLCASIKKHCLYGEVMA